MNPDVEAKFATYPEDVCTQLLAIRTLIFDIASEHELGTVEESLKWGEPSYAVKGGSPVRMNWQAKAPDQLGVYFNCSTSLVATFREVYGDELPFAGNRELTLSRAEPLPLKPLQHCLEVALRYHRLKKLPLLGM
ncbi:DUF1801 domain-containing protein [Aliamphritea hakodatensis]|uniref:DUF1801 domain-containing protein n=1 Tax=Aliamphritea hakodatensis TaxID=2895352 RepID=UPI0022FD5AD8|nr:DUF1801 domain-containing protein [Aliamphritea hakodatensis]